MPIIIHCWISPFRSSSGSSVNTSVKLSGADRGPDGHDAEREADVADAVDQERLLAGQRRAALVVPEADEQVARQADQLPGREHQQVVPGQDQQQHAEHEQVEVGEEPPAARVVRHVADGVDVDQHADGGDHEQHHRGQVVQEQVEGDAEVARRDPLVGRERRSPALPKAPWTSAWNARYVAITQTTMIAGTAMIQAVPAAGRQDGTEQEAGHRQDQQQQHQQLLGASRRERPPRSPRGSPR